MSLTVTGMSAAVARLQRLGGYAATAETVVVNQAAEDVRKGYWLAAARSVGVADAAALQGAKLYKAGSRSQSARLLFSSAGVPVTRFRRYRAQGVGNNATRARILVGWAGGQWKVAAGFINEYGARRAPLSTRLRANIKGGSKVPGAALGPSVAALFKALPDNEVYSAAQAALDDRLERLLAQL